MLEQLTAFIDPTHLAANTAITATTLAVSDPYPRRFDVALTATRTIHCQQLAPGSWQIERQDAATERRLAAYSGVVASSLWSSAGAAGMDPQMVAKLTEIFAWQIDFHREVRRGDRWRLTVERFYSNGQPVRLGAILAAQYDHAGMINAAVLSPQDGSYYNPDGNSLRRMFLRAPLKFARITSGFSAHRFHPILKIARPHLGIDYGAPTGTPVMAVGDGEVSFAANHGGSGNMIALRHNATYQTEYKHLSRFAPGIHRNARVKMGQVIGYVGMTGLATGPHLHFEFHVNGKYTDPSAVRFPAADPVPSTELASFRIVAARELAELPPWSTALLTDARSSRREGADGIAH